MFIALIYLAASNLLFEESDSYESKRYAQKISPYEVESKGSMKGISFAKAHSIMPGNTVSVIEQNGSILQTLTISEIIFPRRSLIKVTLLDGSKIDGRLANQGDYELSLQWRKSRQPLTISMGRNNKNISLSDVDYIEGNHVVWFDWPLNLDFDQYKLSFYQRKSPEKFIENVAEKVKWEEGYLERNNTIYDLFTPPVIYLVDGKLSTSLPEEPLPQSVKEEKFGMELIKFSNEAYPYRLVSWIGETPYFEDTLVLQSPNGSTNVRNRLEVGIPYKRFLDRKPGQPSLVKTSVDDPDKQLTVERFVVQQYQDQRTGGLKIIGRALVKDHKLGGEAFEINNQMKEVFAGNVKIEVKMTLEGLDGKTFSFTTQDQGISFDFGDRVFTVEKIDEVSKSISVVKKGPDQKEQKEQLFVIP